MKVSNRFNSVVAGPRLGVALALLGLAALPLGCKDDDPCDPGQVPIGIGCFPDESGGSSGGPAAPASGAPSDGGAGEAAGGAGPSGPVGNPDATFGTPCQSDAECGGDAPVCATDPLFYCSQTECEEGEANAGACPAEGWVCFKYLDNPSACVNLSSF